MISNFLILYATVKLNVNIVVYTVIILCMRRANERRRHIVTSSLIGSAHTQSDPCISIIISFLQKNLIS